MTDNTGEEKNQIPLVDYFIVAGVRQMTEEVGAPYIHQCKTATEAKTCRKRIAYKPEVLKCHPEVSAADESLVTNVPLFCLPIGALLENWAEECRNNGTQFSTSVLTDKHGVKHYLTSLSFYEKFSEPLGEAQQERLNLCVFLKATRRLGSQSRLGSATVERITHRDGALYSSKSMCIVSRYPFFDAFRRFLTFLYSTLEDGSFDYQHVEPYIVQLAQIPSPTDSLVTVKFDDEPLSFHIPYEGRLPFYGASFAETLKSLGTENFIYAFMLSLLEQKILFHSQRAWLTTLVSETLCAALFPFKWQCPYIPSCPLSLVAMMHAPLPFIVGVQTSCFTMLSDIPSDVTCFNLDSGEVVKRTIKLKSLPKKPLKKLKSTLEEAGRQIRSHSKISLKRPGKTSFDDTLDKAQKRVWEVQVREAFLRFTAEMMYGYEKHLPVVVGSPQDMPDASQLFDVEAFLEEFHRGADPLVVDFYQRLSQTQCFTRFVEECLFKSERSGYTNFFNRCVKKIHEERMKGVTMRLLTDRSEMPAHQSALPGEGRRC